MKKIFTLLLLSVSIAIAANAQRSWDVRVQTKTMLKKAEENPEKNKVTIKRSLLSKKDLLTIKLNEPDTAYNITIEAFADDRSGLQSWEYKGKPLVIAGKDLKKLFIGRNKIQFHYMAIPKDPALAAVVRIRPVHICTVTLN